MPGLAALIAAIALQLSPGPPDDLIRDPGVAATHDYCVMPVQDGLLVEARAALAMNRTEVAPRDRAAAALVTAGTDLASDGHQEPSGCAGLFAGGNTRFTESLEQAERRLRRESRIRVSRDENIARVQVMLRDLWVADQAGRLTYLQLQTSDRSGSDWWAYRRATAHVIASDAISTDAMRGVLDLYDWIDRERFGARTSGQAWLLVQHADHNPDFQRMALERMAPYLESGGVRRQDYAYLWDRVAVNTGRLQRYGTQPMDTCEPDGTLGLKPVEDPTRLGDRRAEMNLGPVEHDLASMAAQRCSG